MLAPLPGTSYLDRFERLYAVANILSLQAACSSNPKRIDISLNHSAGLASLESPVELLQNYKSCVAGSEIPTNVCCSS